jgi:hypothetical protein
MMRLNDHLRRHEWRCACGCINADDEARCWSCRADTDGAGGARCVVGGPAAGKGRGAEGEKGA